MNPRHRAVVHEIRHALGLLGLGAFFFVIGRLDRDGVHGGMLGFLVGLALMPPAAAAAILLLPRPRGLLVRLTVALFTGAATAVALIAIMHN